MLAVTETREQLIEVLTSYEKQPNVLGYDKDIDVGDIRSGRIYKSLFYSSATYVELGKKNGLHLFDYREVVKTANLVPQIYEFLFFRRVS
jgi:seryl-tRNA(Sec) selenium transferase